jgi:probable DNA metabolism protein
LRNEQWVIHDVNRNAAVFWDSEKLVDIDLDPEFAKAAKNKDIQKWNALDEKHYQDLWQTFFDTVAITSRENPKLQRQFMPKRYWNYLTEKSNSQIC